MFKFDFGLDFARVHRVYLRPGRIATWLSLHVFSSDQPHRCRSWVTLESRLRRAGFRSSRSGSESAPFCFDLA
jgi:hypothetical protein